MKTLKPGDRVTATVYGEHRAGVVVNSPSGRLSEVVVWVVWDGREKPAWMNRESLTAEVKQ